MKELKDLKVGDKVIIYSAYGNRDVSAIERITKTLVVVKGNKYRKSDGFRYGNVLYTSDRIEAPKDEEQKKRIELEYRKKIIIHRIHNLNLNDYPLEVLEKVYIEEEGTFAFKSLDKVDNYEPFVNLFEVYVVGNKFDKK